ncbi:MAG: PAS domain S-box protein, partial [Proteobacteria bacterium]|nr:PAS domain S-box protein [Pseudomonadota bacterium]
MTDEGPRQVSLEMERLKLRVEELETELKEWQALQMPRESVEKYRLFVEQAELPICFVDEDGVFVLMNHTAAAQMGGTPDGMVGRTMWELFPEDVASRQMNSISQAVSSKKAVLEEEVTLIGGEARTFRTCIRPVTGTDKTSSYVEIIAIDTTERRRAEEALRESERRFRGVAETMSDFIWEVDHTGKYVFCSGAVKSIFGYASEEMIGKTMMEFVAPGDIERIGAFMVDVMSRRSSFRHLEEWIVDRNGQRKFISTSGGPFFDKAGKFVG